MKHFKAFLLAIAILYTTNSLSQQFRRIETQARLNNITNNNGVAVADFDLDNDLDIFIIGKSAFNNDDPKTWSRLLKNNNDGSFEDVTIEAGFATGFSHDIAIVLNDLGDKLAASWGDYNNDGYPDIYLSNAKQSQLYHNNGNGTFTDVTSKAGLIETCIDCHFAGALWVDLNNDGYLDLYICDYAFNKGNRFYKNNGDETFTLISDTNIRGGANSLSAIPVNINDDEFIDLYVSNDFGIDNYLLINQDGTSFIESAHDYGLQDPHDGMGLATSDYDNDGVFEISVTNIKENGFYVKNNGGYDNLASELGIYDVDWAWGITFSDFNHDGFEDLFVANGFENRLAPNRFFLNTENNEIRSFVETPLTNEEQKLTNSRSTVAFDYDNDGDLDLLVSNFDDNINLYENRSIDTYFTNEIKGNWLKIKLEGVISNKNAFGAKIELLPDNEVNQRRLYHGSGYQSQSIQPVHFGLANASVVKSIAVTWPRGAKEIFNNIPVNTTIKIVEGSGSFIVEDNNTAVKIPGCTDQSSCGYEPLATLNDGSCTFLDQGVITGNLTPEPLSIETYTYGPSIADVHDWEVVNGEIVQGQGNKTIKVKWGIAGKGTLKLINKNNICSTQLIEQHVELKLAPNDQTIDKFSVARLWNESLLEAIRGDFARPTVHARNLFHTSIAMYEAWAIFQKEADTYLIGKEIHGFTSEFSEFVINDDDDVTSGINKAISYASYRLLKHRFEHSPNADETLKLFDDLMILLGYDIDYNATNYENGDSRALGNFIAKEIIEYGLQDGANEANGYNNLYYNPVNMPMVPNVGGSGSITDPNRWQPLSLDIFIDQSGNIRSETTPDFLSPEWGNTLPFALNENSLTTYSRNSNTYKVFYDPGAPPKINETSGESDIYKWGFSLVSIWQSHLDTNDGVMWDISPKSIGNIASSDFPEHFADYDEFYKYIEGGDISSGYPLNPVTKAPYKEQIVPRGDYARVLAEFWADGPDSETPPGHWFTILNYVNDHPLLVKRLNGEGDLLNNLEWDVKSYFILGGTMHDAAIAAWSIKGWYDYIRPISAIRYMADKGQSTDQNLSNYNEEGIPLVEGYIEVVSEGDELAGAHNEHIGKIKLFTWKGHDFIEDTNTDVAGVGWILAENWWPYQRPSFVTPPFAGYVSGHSTYSRAAAEVMTLLTGSEYFPGGIGEFIAKKNKFLVFENGPSQDIVLQWASYRDASDQCSLSRIWGGIHPPMDDIPGRLIGEKVGVASFNLATSFFNKETAEVSVNNGTILYPNPVESFNEITITNVTKSDELILTDFLGKRIPIESNYNEDLNTVKISIGGLTPGIYIFKSDIKTWKIILK